MKKMLTKKIIYCLLMAGMAISFTSCMVSHHHHHHAGKKIPPGQAKKMTGSKSAKQYAPGHR